MLVNTDHIPTLFQLRYRLFRPQMDLAFILLAFGIIMALIFLFTKNTGVRMLILMISWILMGFSFAILVWVLLQPVIM